MMMRTIIFLGLMLLSGCALPSFWSTARFEKLWVFTQLNNEAKAQKLADLNVEYVFVRRFTPENRALADKYGLKLALMVVPNIAESHRQELSSTESNALARVLGTNRPELQGLKGKARNEALKAMHREIKHAYGGEPQVENLGNEVLHYSWGVSCLVGEEARARAAKALTQQLAECPGVEAVFFDFFGYWNYHRCYHPDCEEKYQKFLASRHAEDTPDNEKEFFLGEIVAMNDALHAAVKAYDQKILTVAHLYPVFTPEPLYGHRLKFDRIGETCAWYQQWPLSKVERYARECVTNTPAEFPRSCRVPFIGFTVDTWTERKSAAVVERELRAILAAGAREVMVHEIDSVFKDPEVYAVFRKYCGKK